jgi:hypothetical protein
MIAFLINMTFYSMRYFILLIFLFTNLVSWGESVGEDQKGWILGYSAADGRALSGQMDPSWNEIVKVLDYTNMELMSRDLFHRRVYLVYILGIPSVVESKISPSFISKQALINSFNALSYVTANRVSAKILAGASKEIQEEEEEFVIILVNNYKFYKGSTESSLTNFFITSVHFFGPRSSKETEEKNRIKASFAGKKTMTGVVKSICASIEREYVGASEYLIGATSEEEKVEIASDKNAQLCKPINDLIKETWTNAGQKVWYDLAVAKAAALYQNHERAQEIHPSITVDQPDKFDGSRLAKLMLGADYQYILEILQDKLDLVLKGLSPINIKFLFVNVGFVMPQNERARFAQDVYDKIPRADKESLIIVVPYYSCTENPDNYAKRTDGKSVGQPKKTFPFLFMPAACGKDAGMIGKMNTAFSTETLFSKSFEEAFKHVPKIHRAYIGTVLLNGPIVLSEAQLSTGFVVGYPDFFNVVCRADSRLKEMREKGYLDDCEKKFVALAAAGARVDALEWRADCFARNRAGIRKILREHPVPEFVELDAGHCYLKQSVLAKSELEASNLANLYITGVAGKYQRKFLGSNGESGGDLEEKQMDNKFFYEGQNNLYEKNPILSAIDAGSQLLGLVGFDFIPDAVGALTAYFFGDNEAAAEYAKSIIVTGAMGTLLYKGAKGFPVGREMVEAAAKGKGSLVPIGNELLLVPDDIAGLFVKGDLYARIGLAGEVSLIAKVNPDIDKALMESLFVREGQALKKSPDYDAVLAGLQDPNTINLFKEARKADPKLSLIDFLKKVDLDPIKSILSKASKYGHDKDFLAFFEKELRKVDKKTLDALSSSPDLIDEFYHYQMWNDGKGLQDLFDERKLLEGLPDPVTTTNFKDAPGISVAALGNDKDIIESLKRIKHEDGWFDVIVHSDGTQFAVLQNGEWLRFSHRSLYVWLRKQDGFLEAIRKGNGIRLLACRGGAKDLAENLAKKAGAKVKAANVKIGVEVDGSVTAAKGSPPGHWGEFDGTNWRVKFENQASGVPEASKIPVGTKDKGAGSLDFFDEAVVAEKTLSKASDFDDLIIDLKQSKPDPFIAKMVDDAQANNDTELLSDLLKPKEKTYSEVGASGRSYTKKCSVSKEQLAWDKSNNIYYVPKDQLHKYEVKVKNGNLYIDGNRLDEGETYLFVMDGDGKIYAKLDNGKSLDGLKELHLKHSTLLSGKDVASAGNIWVDGGNIYLNNFSGHYLPENGTLGLIIRELTSRGVDVKLFDRISVKVK